MIRTVLALVDRPAGCEECAAAALELAKDSSAELILAFDPGERTLAAIEAEMRDLVASSLCAGVKTKTMLVHLDDADSVVRAIKCNGVDIVFLPDPASRSNEAAIVARALEGRNIPLIAIALREAVHA